MTRELKHAENAEDSQRDEGAAQFGVVGDAETDVVGQDRDDVDDAHGARHVVTAARSRVQTQQVLGRKDRDAGRVQTEQLDAEPLSAGHPEPTAPVLAARNRLHDVGQHSDVDSRFSDRRNEALRRDADLGSLEHPNGDI